MAGSLNKVMLIGNLGADPDVRTTPNGAQVANFRVACTESWTDQSGQKQERTEWVTIVAWKKLSEIIQRFLRKGSKVYVEGKLQTRTWEDTNGGKRYATEVLCEKLLMLDGRPQGGSGFADQTQKRETGSAQPAGSGGTDDDDLPF